MTAMTSRDRFMAALTGKAVDRLPVVSVCQHATYEQMEALNVFWPDAFYDARAMAKLAGGGYSILGFDSVRLPFCQTHEAEALGAVIKDGGKKDLPSIKIHPYKVGDAVDFPDDFLNRGRIPQLLEGIRLLKAELGDQVIVMGGIIGPFSIAGQVLEITAMLRVAYRKPDNLAPYVEAGEKAGALLGQAMIEAGADVIVIEDMMASLDMISPDIYRKLAQPYEKRLVEKFSVPVIIHVCGKLDRIISDVAQTGCAAISVEPVVNAPAAIEQFKAQGITTPLIGAIDPVNTLYQGDTERVVQETLENIEKGFAMISPGCAVPPATKTVNLTAIVEAVKAVER
ncbi:[methyl-Co(III) methanol-specific corrinoid protein]:coenzyme M methyltransferase [Desulfotomaculum arcticum]|uniref:[methyl-Co(III) methanol-specific corrinoid protein]:coenzyme M methyltransferase n=1 Tax=Desulfotruncus arcticus DSM 17038 TaxID=1121424 RepID=A0A1I2WT23_9FIRM|nr:MtaA/CmuA family methyltransferase [Desulfotruncus arcticus]SFH04483.1 [methyl-Co(III) methanol-specific corrinoid protein]:coenzyme M methyltransferase [Desulfotomaculum arcticum] [Desulfotruncus arcticus DSM 17038]